MTEAREKFLCDCHFESYIVETEASFSKVLTQACSKVLVKALAF